MVCILVSRGWSKNTIAARGRDSKGLAIGEWQSHQHSSGPFPLQGQGGRGRQGLSPAKVGENGGFGAFYFQATFSPKPKQLTNFLLIKQARRDYKIGDVQRRTSAAIEKDWGWIELRMMVDVLQPLFSTCQAKWAEQPPMVMKQS